MLILDELKKNDPHLRLMAVALAAGLLILLAGLWWVQVVSAREYQGHLETQSYRTVRLPAVRGKILDREGRVLAENRPCCNLSIYFDDLSGQFKSEYARLRPVKVVTNAPPFWAFWSRSSTVVTKPLKLNESQNDALTWDARYRVASAVVSQIGRDLDQPLTLNPAKFQRDYETRLAMPYTVVHDATPEQVARFEEQSSGIAGADLDLQPVRYYPNGTLAGHLLGYVLRDDSSKEGEDAFFNYYLPDYTGAVGIEAGFDSVLRGRAGSESMLVNNLGYRHSENILEAPEPGCNVVLTVDLDLQRAAEESLVAHQGADARAAIVVMDVHTGDVLAMVSSPEINPDYPANDPKFLGDPKLTPEINRATQGNFTPGSIFKTVVALAALENGLDPNEDIYNPANPRDPAHGYYKFSETSFKRDTAPPGPYKLKRAIERSCNTYFITVGLRTGIDRIIEMGERFHFGERTGLPTLQDSGGIFPTLAQVSRRDWRDGNTADVCIGQEMAVTPMQVAVEISAIANGGTVLWPRLVERIEPQDPAVGGTVTNLPAGLVRDHLNIHPRSLQILRNAMLGETEDPEGTGQAAQVPGLHICGKTGTAQLENEHGDITGHNYWFASFAPYENPRYAVVVMVQADGSIGSGGSVCAPIAHDIYEEIVQKEQSGAAKNLTRN